MNGDLFVGFVPAGKSHIKAKDAFFYFKEGQMVINHNMSAAYANRLLQTREANIGENISKLSSGMRINKGADDASGLAVSEKLRAQVRGLNQAGKNIENAVSFIQTSEGYMSETQDILHRMRELAVQSANGIYTPEDREQIQVEIDQLVDEVNRISEHAEFNGMPILKGDFSKDSGTPIVFQVGANMDQKEEVSIGNISADALFGAQAGGTAAIDMKTADSANSAIGTIDTALRQVSKQRADLGAYQNRFQMASEGVSIAAENMQAAESRIRDTDMATEMVDYVKNQILMQAGTAMLAQANMKSQSVIQLLG
jgi:flagellin